MVQVLIRKEHVDIFKYPEEFEDSLGTVSLGDGHGSALKFFNFVLRNKILKFKQGEKVAAEKAYQEFVDLYEKNGELIESLLQHPEKIKKKEADVALFEHMVAISEGVELLLYKTSLQNALNVLEAVRKEETFIKDQLTEQLRQFKQFIEQLEIEDKKTLIRLIGDEFADRGFNDYFTLILLKLVSQDGAKIHNILISNHGLEFIAFYEHYLKTGEFRAQGTTLNGEFVRSLQGLQTLIRIGLVSADEIINIVNTVYKPALKLIDYTLNEEGINLFTHAPVRFDVIKRAAARLGVVYDDSTKEALAGTIEQINAKFGEMVANNTVHEHFNAADHTCPLTEIIWNRWDDSQDIDEARPAFHNGYKMSFYHGHDPYESKYPHVFNMDSGFGMYTKKKQAKLKGEAKADSQLYLALNSDEQSLQKELSLEKCSVVAAANSGFFKPNLKPLGNEGVNSNILNVF
jgi:hypothetical protein